MLSILVKKKKKDSLLIDLFLRQHKYDLSKS